MRSGLGYEQERSTARSSPETAPYPPATPSAREIPYDYVAKFVLEGERGKRKQDVISISIEAAFIATSIGYGFFPRAPTMPSGIAGTIESGPSLTLTSPTLAFPATLEDLIAEAAVNELTSRLGTGITINRDDARAYLVNAISTYFRYANGIDFKYTIVDSGTGRELQNQPIYSIAGLGSADGERPFRPFPKPMMFLPRSTIRIEVEEISTGDLYRGAELQIVLHGYKVLGPGT